MSLDTVTVRLTNSEISVYRELLTAVSTYFKKAFDGSFKEADEGSITLVDVTEQTFRIFLQWAYAQMSPAQLITIPLCKDLLLTQESAKSGAAVPHTPGTIGGDDESDSSSDLSSDLSMASVRNVASIADFDEGAFHYDPEGLGRTRYWKNNEWLANYRSLVLSILRLYIFADKYSVPQLRDDIMTAFMGQCWAMDWFPDPDKEMVATMYDELPGSSTMVKFLVHCTALLWLTEPGQNCARNLQSIRAMNPDFAFDVSMVLAKTIQDHKTSTADARVSMRWRALVKDACFLHEHSALDQDQCRQRISNNPHIFAAMMTACKKDAMSQSTTKA